MVTFRDFDRLIGLKQSDADVLRALVRLTDGKRRQIKISTICQEAGVAYRTVQYALDRLERQKRIRRRGPGARVAYYYEVLDDSER
jgi:predicted transcriptional regulator